MLGPLTLIPARYFTLLGHFTVLVNLLWNIDRSVHHCLPTSYQTLYIEVYHTRLMGGIIASLFIIMIEFITLIYGLDLFSASVALTSIAMHGIASIMLTHFLFHGWICSWYWVVFLFCSVLPSALDLGTCIYTMWSDLKKENALKKSN